MTYDPNEPRDDHGQWSSEGGVNDTHPSGVAITLRDKANAEHADLIAGIASGVAKKLNFDPKMIRISDEHRTFELNGKTLNNAGVAYLHDPFGREGGDHPEAGKVVLFQGHVSENNVAGVTAHEIAHQKFQAFRMDSRREQLAMEKDPDYQKETKWVRDETGTSNVTQTGPEGTYKVRREPGFMNPDGTLNEPYAARYPAYQAWTKAMMPGTDKFAKSDGVSDYSAEYWKAFHAGTVPTDTPFHETLAEIARLKHTGDQVEHRKLGEVEGKPVYFRTTKGLGKVKPEWAALHRAVEENWKRRSK